MKNVTPDKSGGSHGSSATGRIIALTPNRVKASLLPISRLSTQSYPQHWELLTKILTINRNCPKVINICP
jgi:hypothetical protein